MARSQIPKFGDWESEEIPYSICFDNASKSKKSGLQNNHPEKVQVQSKGQNEAEVKSPKLSHPYNHEYDKQRRLTDSPLNPNAMRHSHAQSSTQKPEADAFKVPGVNRPRHKHKLSQEGDLKKVTDSPLQNTSAGDTPKRVGRQSAGSDRSVDHSPLHPQLRVGGKVNTGLSSPSWERKSTSEWTHGGLAPSTPGRSRLRSVTKGDETPDHSPAVPKFGEWDETDPASAEGYSLIFNRVREGKNTESGKVPIMPAETSYTNGQKQYEGGDTKGCGCFPWGR